MRTLPHSLTLGTFHPSTFPVLCSNLTSESINGPEPVSPKIPWGKKAGPLLLLPRWMVQQDLTQSVDHVSGTALRASHIPTFSLTLTTTLLRCYPNSPFYKRKKLRPRKVKLTCPSAHSWLRGEPGSNPREPGSTSHHEATPSDCWTVLQWVSLALSSAPSYGSS